MVRNFAAFLILIWTDRHFAPTYFKLLPGLNSGSDFLLLAKFLNQEPWYSYQVKSQKSSENEYDENDKQMKNIT